MKTLKFKDFKADLILSGEKTASMRLFDDKDLSVGDELELINSDTKEVFARAVITEIIIKKLGEITDLDLVGHEKWDSKQDMLETHRRFYGDRVIEATEAKIVRFKLI